MNLNGMNRMTVEQIIEFAKKWENRMSPKANRVIGNLYTKAVKSQEEFHNSMYYIELLPLEGTILQQALNVQA